MRVERPSQYMKITTKRGEFSQRNNYSTIIFLGRALLALYKVSFTTRIKKNIFFTFFPLVHASASPPPLCQVLIKDAIFSSKFYFCRTYCLSFLMTKFPVKGTLPGTKLMFEDFLDE